MKKFLGIVAVALIVGAPALAQNASTMTYHLQLNGTPSVTPGTQYDTSTATEATYTMAKGVDVLNWSARVEVGGTIDGVLPGGVANAVVDIALKKDAALVGGGDFDTDGGFGITTGAEAGFFSVVMTDTAGGPFAQQPAAFPWVFNTWYDPDGTETDTNPIPPFGYGRLIDTVQNNGPNMAQFTYPSTFKYYRPAGAAAANTTTVTAASGTLMGMGAGYTDFNFTPDAPERGGVGLTADNGQQCYGCTPGFWCMDIAGRPVIEGQINMKGLPAGTYTLELTAGTGNNVLLPTIACSPYTGGTAGAFAAAAATPTGDTITFVYDPTITVTPPVMASAASVRTHGAAGTFPVALNITGAGNATSEGRIDTAAGSNPMVVVTYDKAVSGGADLPTVTATAVGGAAPTVGTPVVAGTTLQIPLTGSVDKTCVTLTITGVKTAGSTAAPVHTVKVTYRKGDVDNSRSVGPADINGVKAKSSIQNVNATNFWYDLDCSGKTGPSDITLVKSLSALGTTACALP